MPKFRIGDKVWVSSCVFDYPMGTVSGLSEGLVQIRGVRNGVVVLWWHPREAARVVERSPFEQDLQDYIDGELHCAS